MNRQIALRVLEDDIESIRMCYDQMKIKPREIQLLYKNLYDDRQNIKELTRIYDETIKYQVLILNNNQLKIRGFKPIEERIFVLKDDQIKLKEFNPIRIIRKRNTYDLVRFILKETKPIETPEDTKKVRRNPFNLMKLILKE